MKDFKILFLIILALTTMGLSSCSLKKKTNEDHLEKSSTNSESEEELKIAWKVFTTAILKHDIPLIKSLSTNCIRCSSCVKNTTSEDSILKAFQLMHPDTWYEKFYSELVFIPIDRFLEEDLDLIFNDNIKSRLTDSTKLVFIDNKHNLNVYSNKCIYEDNNNYTTELKEVLVTYIDTTPQDEGWQWAYAFIRSKEGFRFCGFSTIP